MVVGGGLDGMFHEAARHWDAGRLDDAERLLVLAAEGGHGGAMARLGRLYCLEPHGQYDGVGAAERWLRRAVAVRSDDHLAGTLLASLLVRWGNAMIEGQVGNDEPELSEWYRWPDRVGDEYWRDESLWPDWEDSALERRTVEAHDTAERLLARVLADRPGDVAAAMTLAALWYGRWMAHRIISDLASTSDDAAEVAERMGRELAARRAPVLERAAALDGDGALGAWCRALAAGRDDRAAVVGDGEAGAGGHSWYLLRRTFVCSNNGDLGEQLLLTADLGELRWAASRWARRWRALDAGKGESLVLLVRDGGDTAFDLTGRAGVDRAAADVPPLRGVPLPAGRPAAVPGWAGPVFYGFTDSGA
jgi:hypothetical protein